MKTGLNAACLAAAAALTLMQPAAAQEKLTFIYPTPLNAANEKIYTDWGKKVTADSNNAVAVEIRATSPLVNFFNVIDRVENDVLQLGFVVTPLIAGKFELTNVVQVPFLVDLDDDFQASAAVWRLYKQGLLDNEFTTVVPIMIGISKQSGFHFAKAPRSLDDLSGIKMRIFHNSQTIMTNALGMTAVSMQPSEVYQALQRGTIDANLTSWSTFPVTKLHEVTKYHVELPLGGSALMMVMAKKKLEGLPAAARSAIDANRTEQWSRAYGSVLLSDANEGRQLSAAAGNTIVQVDPAKGAEWRAKFGDAMIENYLKANGTDAPKVVDAFKKAYADVKAGR